MFAAAMPPLAVDHIRHVGEGVAIVVAETLSQALDASERVRIDLEELTSTPDVLSATASGAVAIHEGRPGNIALDWTDGGAHHAARERLFDHSRFPSLCGQGPVLPLEGAGAGARRGLAEP